MTITIRQKKINGTYIAIEKEKYSEGYNVSAYPVYSDGTCGYPVSVLSYANMKKASCRFNALCRKAKNNQI